ncbi:MAG TPA: hypothetical protein VF458_02680 [Ktedonobacteraceae bacterium]
MVRQSTHHSDEKQHTNTHALAPRRFSAGLHELYLALASSIEGVEDASTRKRSAALLLYRLMFLYFIQQMGLLRGERDYLQRRLEETRETGVSFYRAALRPLFCAKDLALPGTSLFSSREFEERSPGLEIDDELFQRLFALFEAYEWRASGDLPESKQVVTPEIMGTLFERQLHPREMGTYYTPREVTSYIARNTLLPALLARARAHDVVGDRLEKLLWQHVSREPLRYIYASALQGRGELLPTEIAAGLENVALRSLWQQRAPWPYALAGETWREVIARRARVELILDRAAQDVPVALDQLVAWNLDLHALVLETLRTCQEPELVLACYQSLRQLSVLDPTCGTGAFLCAVIPLLQDLHAACLARVEELLTTPNSLPAEVRHAFQALLKEAGEPDEHAYTSLLWIINHTLYGIDLNAEAVEVCRLRLCQALLATQTRPGLAGLADDFKPHVCVGNSLLGSLAASTDQPLAPDQPEPPANQRAFPWHNAFPDPMRRGGFDAVIGNPPYVEYPLVRPLYTLDGYTTLETGNLYALTMERAAFLLAPGGHFGMIVPASATCATGYRSLQKLLLAQHALHIASFSDQRGHLFSMPHPRLCIILYTKVPFAHPAPAIPASRPRVFTTPYLKLGSRARVHLFERLSYTEVTPQHCASLIPRYGSLLELAIERKLASQQRLLGFYLQRQGAYPIYFTRKLSWYVQVTPFIPRILDAQGQTRSPSELKNLRFCELPHARMAFAALNSNLFYWLITTRSDCRNLNMREVQSLPLDLASIQPALQQELCQLSYALEDDLLKHARMRPMLFQKHGHLTIQCLYPARSKPLIDEIDRALARHFAFNALELDFLLHYDEQYRRGSHIEHGAH